MPGQRDETGEPASTGEGASDDGGLSRTEIDLIRHRLGMPTLGPEGNYPRHAGTSEAISGFLTAAYASEGLHNFPLPGRPPVRGFFSTGVVVMTTRGFVVGQRTGENYRSTNPVLQPEPILTTSDALRVANAQRPGLTPHLFYSEGEKLMVTSFEFGAHAANDRTLESALVRHQLLRGLPEALAAFTTMRIPLAARRHPHVDSSAKMIDRARRVRADRYSDEQLRRTARLGIDDALLDELSARAERFTPREPGVLHNDIHYDNALVRVAPRRDWTRSNVCLLDLQFVTVGDPMQDIACSAVKLQCTMAEIVDLTGSWADRLEPAKTDGVAQDLPTGMAIVSATQSAVRIPNALNRVYAAAEQDRSRIDSVLEEAVASVHLTLAPALALGRDMEVTPEWVRARLSEVIPRDPAMIATPGLARVSASQRQPKMQPPSKTPDRTPERTPGQSTPGSLQAEAESGARARRTFRFATPPARPELTADRAPAGLPPVSGATPRIGLHLSRSRYMH
ncbi:phosphotransferase family protein [Yinghuangia sp. YIM S10712]|uniref:phosphotransferase family protein n=1 Tax=Yinghuangia sp. YIM S10712 TaxID=3436930 RepID=UPI003F531FB7